MEIVGYAHAKEPVYVNLRALTSFLHRHWIVDISYFKNDLKQNLGSILLSCSQIFMLYEYLEVHDSPKHLWIGISTLHGT